MDEPAGIFLTTLEVRNNQNPFSVTYLNGSMPMINCSRSAISPLKLLWIINQTGEQGFISQAESMLERAQWLKDSLDKMSWPAWLEPASNTSLFQAPARGHREKIRPCFRPRCKAWRRPFAYRCHAACDKGAPAIFPERPCGGKVALKTVHVRSTGAKGGVRRISVMSRSFARRISFLA